IGPWTSIPGLFFGPGWYYLLAPAYWLNQGSPLAGAWTMFILYLIGIILAFRYLGIYEAIILATAPLWLQLSSGASNAFPISLVGLLLVIGLKKKLNPFWLGIILGLGFHFSSALAVFWLLLIPLLLKPKLWLKMGAGIFITFIPQLLFELKHNFSQTQAVINYFTAGESQHLTPGKIALVSQSIAHELSLAVLPDNAWLKIIGLIILAVGIIYVVRRKKFGFWPEILLLTLIPTIGFWFLHYNPWYSYGLLPLAVVAVGKILRALPKPLAYFYLLLLIVNSGYKLASFYTSEKSWLNTHKGFLPAKMQALNYIYEQAGDQPFASYQYHPEIYDYAYQYLYIWQGFKGKPLPVEFSYQPGAPTYVNEKENLLKLVPTRLRQDSDGQRKIFLIIEKPDNIWHYPFDSWLKQINFSKVVDKKIIGPELEVWQVIP
ncbi:hypothetical protein KKH13_04115, partial [Patescibacteria group bacterium]|nr:hypothetical protein [Patescibacteria group bacterium]